MCWWENCIPNQWCSLFSINKFQIKKNIANDYLWHNQNGSNLVTMLSFYKTTTFTAKYISKWQNFHFMEKNHSNANIVFSSDGERCGYEENTLYVRVCLFSMFQCHDYFATVYTTHTESRRQWQNPDDSCYFFWYENKMATRKL